jgi:hypothetical protein
VESPWWPTLTVWAVVNVVNVCQSVGFVSRRRHGMRINRIMGLVIAAMAVPATIALFGFVAAGSPWWIGPAAFDAFVLLMIVVDYVHPVEFRNPARPLILVPYLVLFFGSVLLMGLPMFRVDRSLWLVTLVTSVALLATMALAERRARNLPDVQPPSGESGSS